MVDEVQVENHSSRRTTAGVELRHWTWVAALAVGLALMSLAPKFPGGVQPSGEADVFLTFQFTARKLANSGTFWAGLGIVSGWLVRRRVQAAVAGAVAGLVALFLHYAAGQAVGLFDSGIWVTKVNWFIAAAIFGGPLGLVGAFSRRPDGWGLMARLLIPAGAVLEPFVRGMFINPATMTAPHQVSNVLAGSVLLGGGLLSGAAIIAADRGMGSIRGMFGQPDRSVLSRAVGHQSGRPGAGRQ